MQNGIKCAKIDRSQQEKQRLKALTKIAAVTQDIRNAYGQSPKSAVLRDDLYGEYRARQRERGEPVFAEERREAPKALRGIKCRNDKSQKTLQFQELLAFINDAGVCAEQMGPAKNQTDAQRQRDRFGEEEQRRERALTLKKDGASDTELAPTWCG